jgi:hypothetical protein
MKTAVIMPSIRTPQNLEAWSALLGEDDVFIIAGNEKSPHEDIEVALLQAAVKFPDVTFDYLRPSDKRCTETYINEFIEPNHTHRRNFALLEALRYGADMIVTVDDDNFPAYEPSWITKAATLLDDPNSDRLVATSASGWFNPGDLCLPPVTHRGYPISQRQEPGFVSYVAPADQRIGVVAGLWLGDPDIDAMERIIVDPTVHGIRGSVTLAPGTWGPFDSQSTAICRELAPLMFMWTHVGRYDDIWCSYLMRAIMDATNWHVTYGEPLVKQERNPHNLIRDLKDELFGYEHTEELCAALRVMSYHLKEENTMMGQPRGPWEMFKYIVTDLPWAFNRLPLQTYDGLKAWIKDVDELSPV